MPWLAATLQAAPFAAGEGDCPGNRRLLGARGVPAPPHPAPGHAGPGRRDNPGLRLPWAERAGRGHGRGRGRASGRQHLHLLPRAQRARHAHHRCAAGPAELRVERVGKGTLGGLLASRMGHEGLAQPRTCNAHARMHVGHTCTGIARMLVCAGLLGFEQQVLEQLPHMAP